MTGKEPQKQGPHPPATLNLVFRPPPTKKIKQEGDPSFPPKQSEHGTKKYVVGTKIGNLYEKLMHMRSEDQTTALIAYSNEAVDLLLEAAIRNAKLRNSKVVEKIDFISAANLMS
ncbi:hypothetical protein FO519_005556 [Halicephalobus sp. NKZ332]|nr:hypothetical protein FO519_005556 [Halicephalobus sp. NKZ332]